MSIGDTKIHFRHFQFFPQLYTYEPTVPPTPPAPPHKLHRGVEDQAVYGWQELTSTTWMTPYVPYPLGPQYIESTRVAQYNVPTSGFVLQAGNFSNKGRSPARSYILNTKKSFFLILNTDRTVQNRVLVIKKADAERPKN